MSKIVHFNTYIDNAIDFLDKIKEEAGDQQIDNVIIACKCNNGDVITGYTKNLDYGTRMELVGHLQSDIIKTMIDNNYLT